MKQKEANKLVEKNKPYCFLNDKCATEKKKRESKDFYNKNGFYFEECWNLDHTIACFILPRLVHFKKVHTGTPANLTAEEWDNILDKMINAFSAIVEESSFYNLEKETIIEEGLNLFIEYFRSLWD